MIARFGMLFFLLLRLFFLAGKEKCPIICHHRSRCGTEPVREAVDQDAAGRSGDLGPPAGFVSTLVYGTVKGFGIEAYDLAGKRKFSYPIGNPNNIDVAYGFVLSEEEP
ncbi:MAG: phytase [Haliscomenobacter sp.]|nr:phytase [Haliscomenobacter sp.]